MTFKEFMTTYWPLATVAGVGLVAWGTTTADLTRLKEDAAAAKSDHDLIVEMRTEQRAIREDIQEIKESLSATRPRRP